MTQVVAKYAMKKMLSKEMDKYQSKSAAGPYDPYYDQVPHPRNPNKLKKVKKQIPAYIPEQEANVLAKARKTAYRLDYALFNFGGLRFGWSSVIGIVPAVGDVVDAALSLNLIRNMRKVECGLPSTVLVMMLVNMLVDFLIGLIPFVGDLADAAVKANGKNVRLLEEHLDKVYKPENLRKRDSQLPSSRRPRPASVYVDFEDEIEERRGAFDHDDHTSVSEPQRVYTSHRPHDEEMGGGYGRDGRDRYARDEREYRTEKVGRKSTKKSSRR